MHQPCASIVRHEPGAHLRDLAGADAFASMTRKASPIRPSTFWRTMCTGNAGIRRTDQVVAAEGALGKFAVGRNNPLFQGNLAHNLALVDAVKALATHRGCTPAQLALAWPLSRGEQIVPIPGTRSVVRLDENARATAIAPSADELRRIDATLAERPVAGQRYAAAGMVTLNG